VLYRRDAGEAAQVAEQMWCLAKGKGGLQRRSGYRRQPCTIGFLYKSVPTAKAELRYGSS
jgi:hypothetical protein